MVNSGDVSGFPEVQTNRKRIEYSKIGGRAMFPIIDRKRTGIRLRRIMDERGLSVKDVQRIWNSEVFQSVYHWLNGLSMPTIDNLYGTQ